MKPDRRPLFVFVGLLGTALWSGSARASAPATREQLDATFDGRGGAAGLRLPVDDRNRLGRLGALSRRGPETPEEKEPGFFEKIGSWFGGMFDERSTLAFLGGAGIGIGIGIAAGLAFGAGPGIAAGLGSALLIGFFINLLK